jgi:hypothetical protein
VNSEDKALLKRLLLAVDRKLTSIETTQKVLDKKLMAVEKCQVIIGQKMDLLDTDVRNLLLVVKETQAQQRIMSNSFKLIDGGRKTPRNHR